MKALVVMVQKEPPSIKRSEESVLKGQVFSQSTLIATIGIDTHFLPALMLSIGIPLKVTRTRVHIPLH